MRKLGPFSAAVLCIALSAGSGERLFAAGSQSDDELLLLCQPQVISVEPENGWLNSEGTPPNLKSRQPDLFILRRANQGLDFVSTDFCESLGVEAEVRVDDRTISVECSEIGTVGGADYYRRATIDRFSGEFRAAFHRRPHGEPLVEPFGGFGLIGFEEHDWEYAGHCDEADRKF